ncbi:hypothetical protein NPIL_163481 [Nephila pilipes]|uniref:Uncharacterized protein n=1 Tax=Nephila pilipes TaxID=299642 RepID=A0A8X6MS91_NEPPI|nr:hypothetical protein NPIL_163481 [Nephila pilipes]
MLCPVYGITSQLSFQAAISSYILKQVSLQFTNECVEFIKYETRAWFVQIPNLSIEGMEMNHVQDTQVRGELAGIVSEYKLEKTKSADVSMKIM